VVATTVPHHLNRTHRARATGQLASTHSSSRIRSTVPLPLGMVLLRGTASRVSPAHAAEFRKRLLALRAEFEELEDEDPRGVSVHMLLGWYTVSA
jgi:hypothetical protein